MTERIIQESRKCLNCGTVIELAPWQVRGKAGKYCSHQCYWEFKASGWIERFWSKVDKRGPSECWPWKAGCLSGKNGNYGMFAKQDNRVSKGKRAHGIAFELTYGPIPKGLIVRHKCDNPPCCNPAHLESGTHKDNTSDMFKRGRANTPKGERHGNAKLTRKAVLDIRSRYSPGVITHQALADEYGVSREAVSYALRRRSWAHVE